MALVMEGAFKSWKVFRGAVVRKCAQVSQVRHPYGGAAKGWRFCNREVA